MSSNQASSQTPNVADASTNGSFHRLTREQRVLRVAKYASLDREEIAWLSGEKPFPSEIAEHLIENVVGTFAMPFGIATHFSIDGVERMIPMVVEETSIVAAASATAKWVAREGWIKTEVLGDRIIGQIQIPLVQNLDYALRAVSENKTALIQVANEVVPGLVKRGGGVKDLLTRVLDREDGRGKMLVLHVECDPCDAMGANLINQVCEVLKPFVERLTDERVGLCILSNLVDGKRVKAEVVIPNVDPVLGQGIEEASQFALSDPYRAATHNKGILNGIDSVLLATGNDWRAVEAGMHAYASQSGKYKPLSRWKMQSDGSLKGEFEGPLAVGTVGGVTKVHPLARIALKILKVSTASELARICAAVGLVQNLGALRALSTVGIVKGHMQLHAANLAIAAGAEAHEIERVKAALKKILQSERFITHSHAERALAEIRHSGKN